MKLCAAPSLKIDFFGDEQPVKCTMHMKRFPLERHFKVKQKNCKTAAVSALLKSEFQIKTAPIRVGISSLETTCF